MLPQRPYAHDDSKTLPDLESTNEQLFFIEDFLKPIRFNALEDVYELLVYLLHTKKINITEDGRINVPDEDELIREFVVDSHGETYLFGKMREFINNNTIITVKLDIKQQPGMLPQLGGEVVKQTLLHATAFDVDINLPAGSKMIPFISMLENVNKLTYNQVLATMIKHLNPHPYGLLNVVAPDKANTQEQILLPTYFHTSYVTELKDKLTALGHINHAALDLILLGYRQKESRHRNMPANETLMHKLSEMKKELLLRITADEAGIVRLEQYLADRTAEAAALRLAHDKHVRKHPQYGLQRADQDVKAKNSLVQSRHRSHQNMIGIAFMYITIGIGLAWFPYEVARTIHYGNRIKPFQAIVDYRDALNKMDSAQSELNQAIEHAQENKKLINTVINIIDGIMSQTVAYRGVPPIMNTSVTTQSIFQHIAVTPSAPQLPAASEELQVPSKEDVRPPSVLQR